MNFAISFCVIMTAIFSYKTQCVNKIITTYNILLQIIENITTYSIEKRIKRRVL